MDACCVYKRLVARLDIKGPNVVKGVHLEGLRVLGAPKDYANYYSDQCVDELMFQDVVASLYGRNSLDELIAETARDIFLPITVGGGIRSLADIYRVLRVGADKVAINTAATHNPQFIDEAVRVFGSSTLVIAIEAIRGADGQYYAFTDNGREGTGLEVTNWAKEAAERGAGEIIVTSVDREGTGRGIDVELVQSVSDVVSVPVVCHGGVGRKQHVVDALALPRVHGVSFSSITHYQYLANAAQNKNMGLLEGNYDYVRSGRSTYANVEPCTVVDLRTALFEAGIKTRQVL